MMRFDKKKIYKDDGYCLYLQRGHVGYSEPTDFDFSLGYTVHFQVYPKTILSGGSANTEFLKFLNIFLRQNSGGSIFVEANFVEGNPSLFSGALPQGQWNDYIFTVENGVRCSRFLNGTKANNTTFKTIPPRWISYARGNGFALNNRPSGAYLGAFFIKNLRIYNNFITDAEASEMRLNNRVVPPSLTSSLIIENKFNQKNGIFSFDSSRKNVVKFTTTSLGATGTPTGVIKTPVNHLDYIQNGNAWQPI
jgi:hypothetical protein